MLKRFVIVIFFLLIFLKTNATHIVGGEIYYDYLGNNQYRITLKVYRDCYNGIPPLDNPAHIDIFDKFGNIVKSMDVPLMSLVSVPPSINNSCIQAPNTVCVEEGTYQFVEILPPLNGGYYIVYQRCCRNNTILNLVAPGSVGATYWEHIPGPEVAQPNSSPRFKNFPPIFICNGLNINFDHSAIDPDGDVLVYSLCSAFNGLDACCPFVNGNVYSPSTGNYCNSPPPSCPANYPPPPYANVPYISPYSGTYPMASSPAINIHPNTGLLTGNPNLNGQWVVSVCVSEYRNGQLIGVHQREFQFNVVTCTVTVVSAIQDQTQKCNGLTVQFINQSVGANTYFWDFGDPSTLADTSHLPNPSYTYPDTGMYQVTLVANPNKPCSDTTKKTFYVYPKFNPTFTTPSPQCLTSNSFSFNVGGEYASYTQFQWNFGPNATPSISTLPDPTGIYYDTSGYFPVTVTITQQPCDTILSGVVEVISPPEISATPMSATACVNNAIQLQLSTSHLENPVYQWYFSNGSFSKDSIPKITFNTPGIYSYSVFIQSNGVCTATFNINAVNSITVFPNPIADFVFSPTITTIFDPDILFMDNSQSGSYESFTSSLIQWKWTLEDGTILNDVKQFIHIYANYGEYYVSLEVTNTYGCKDKVRKKITILPEHRFWVPNAFTPNNDGLNDVFLPIVYGVENYVLEIYDRWGERIFYTENFKQGWDGYYKGVLCKEDVYVWRINFKNVISKRQEEHLGHVTLIR